MSITATWRVETGRSNHIATQVSLTAFKFNKPMKLIT